MSLNEIALALTAYLCIVFCDRIAESVQKPVMAIAVLAVYIPAVLYLLYFMGRSVLCYFGK